MYHNPKNIRKINRLRNRCLHIIKNGKLPSFSELLEKEDSVSTHMRNIQSPATQVFCVCRNLSPQIMNNIFAQKNNSQYNLKKICEFSRALVKSGFYERQSVSFLKQEIWDSYLIFAKI